MNFNPTRSAALFNEEEETELAAELLAAGSERELDHVLGGLLRRATTRAGTALPYPVAGTLGGWVKGAVRRVLPDAGRSVTRLFGSTGGSQTGRLAADASRTLGVELEGMSGPDQEFSAARQLVRLAGAAVAGAGTGAATVAPGASAQQAIIRAAQVHAPGLLRARARADVSTPCGCGGHGGCSCHGRRHGVWRRQGNAILLQGI